MAVAPFDGQIVRVPVAERGVRYGGTTLGARSDALAYHLVKRVVLEQKWMVGTTANEYLADLSAAILHPSARLVVYARRGGHVAATVTPTDQVLPRERRGPRPGQLMLVVYAADRGMIVTGYQVSGLETASVPEDAQWLS